METHINNWEDKLEDEMRFLHQDGYAGGWAEMKKNAIKEIVSLALKSERQRVVEMVRGMRINPALDIDDMMSDIHTGYNEALSDIITCLEADNK